MVWPLEKGVKFVAFCFGIGVFLNTEIPADLMFILNHTERHVPSKHRGDTK